MAPTASRMPILLSKSTGLRAFYSTNVVSEFPILVRDFIHSALYDPNLGYFSQQSGSVGVLQRSIKFNQLNGRKEYMELVDKIYKQNGVSWFTPVELFKPWYAHGIAEAIMRTADLSVPLRIFEIGGGSGVCAKGIMDYILLNAPTRVYANMSYICIEISPSLAERQVETIGVVSSHFSKFRVECRDATDASGWGEVQHQPCWVIMLEVLDNLPHDVIHSENQVSQWLEVWLDKKHDGGSSLLSETYKPLGDALVKRCIDVMDSKDCGRGDGSVPMIRRGWSRLFPKPRRRWLPTGSLKLLDALHGAFSKMSMIASDFSYLPDVRVLGEGAPLVSRKIDGRSCDLDSYLDAKGDADIFFPTDFGILERIDHHCSGWAGQGRNRKMGEKRRVITLDTSSFMEEFGLPSKTVTKEGYNPLLEDFKNTKFYLSVPTHNI